MSRRGSMETCVAENSENVEGGTSVTDALEAATDATSQEINPSPVNSLKDECVSHKRGKLPKDGSKPTSPRPEASCDSPNLSLNTLSLEEHDSPMTVANNSSPTSEATESQKLTPLLSSSESLNDKSSSSQTGPPAANAVMASPTKTSPPKANSKGGGAQVSASSAPVKSCAQTAKSIPTTSKHSLPGTINSGAGKPDKNIKRNREDKIRKKDERSLEHVFRALSCLEHPEAKLGAMCQKYAEIFDEHRLLQNAAKLCEKKNSVLQKEKEQLQAEHSKAILTRSRLESLCRELQRQNKAVKEECMLKIREEEEKKREVAAKFQTTLTELGNLLAHNHDKNAKLKDDNLDMTTKLKSVCEQYERKEQHVEKLAKQMKLEMQLADAKLAKAKMEMAMEKETLLREKQQLLLELSQYQTQLEEMKLSEVALHNQIQLYNDKYDEFHRALLQSNEAIGGFKQEMERMSKQIRKLEKETVSWKSRYEAAHQTLLQMSEEKIKSDQNVSAANRKLVALQGLCRSLQAQCTSLRNELKGAAASNNTPVLEEDLMNQVEKELNESGTNEGLVNDNTPCPRHQSREGSEQANGATNEIDNQPRPNENESPLQLTEICAHSEDQPHDVPPSSELKTCSVQIESSPVDSVCLNGEIACSEAVDNKTASFPPLTQQTKKNKSKKKNKK